MAAPSPRIDREQRSSALSSAGNRMIQSTGVPAYQQQMQAGTYYASANPYPGASSLVVKQMPKEEDLVGNDGTFDPNLPVQQGKQPGFSDNAATSDFRQISPRSRTDRRTVQAKDELLRERASKRLDGFFRHPHQNARNHHNPFDLGTGAASQFTGTMDDRYGRDAATYLKSCQTEYRRQQDSARAARRLNTVRQEQDRWNRFDADASSEQEKWNKFRETSLKAKANLNSLPFDPITLQTKDSVDGVQYEYEEGLMDYRAALRSKNFYGKYNQNGFNPINGEKLWDSKMPSQPLTPQELELQKLQEARLKVVKLVKKRLLEAGGPTGIHTFGLALRSQGMTEISVPAFVNTLKSLGIDDIPEERIAEFISYFANESQQAKQQPAPGTLAADGESILSTVRGPLSPERQQLIELAWKRVDPHGVGNVPFQLLLDTYNPKHRKDVVCGDVSEGDALKDFFASWFKQQDSAVTASEFSEYYHGVGAGIYSDKEFRTMMKAAWRLEQSISQQKVILSHKSGEQTIRDVPGEPLPLTMPRAAMMHEIQRRLREAGVQFITCQWA